MYSEKKRTKEDTWRSDELMKHIQGQDEENRKRERTKRDETHRKQRGGESMDRRHREPGERRERDKPRERDSTRERGKHRESERDIEDEKRRKEEREKRKEREKHGEKRDSERRTTRDEKENRDREKERQRERYKDRDREVDSSRYKEGERDKGTERDRERERDKEKDRHRNRERDKEREETDRLKEREREKERSRQKERDGEEDRERERRRAEREKERMIEKERRKEREGSRDLEEKHREKDKERERRERHRERGERHGDEDRGKREKRDHRENTGHLEKEERSERRRREKEFYETGERPRDEPRETDRQHRYQDREERQERERMRDKEARGKNKERGYEESKKSSGDQRHDRNDSKLRKHEQVSIKGSESVWRSNDAEISDPEIPAENEVTEDNNKLAEDYADEDYEEDFEKMDYEEDFEEMEEDDDKQEEKDETEEKERPRELSPQRRKEIEAIQRAMQQENELVNSIHSQTTSRKNELSQRVTADSESFVIKSRTHGKVIDFASARQRAVTQQAADKQKKRSAELSRLIDLDFSVTMCLLDLPPVSEYDMYIKSFGMANTKQAYVQCNEDNTDRDTQTEETDSMDKWTQHPPETYIACGGPKISQAASEESVVRMNVDSKRLTTFLRSAAQVMAVLLEENRAESNSVKKLHSQTDSLSFSDGCIHLNTKLPFLNGRQVTLLHFSQVQTHTLLTVHSPCSGSSSERLDSKTLICVWNIWEPSSPQRILIYEAELRCCCFSPEKAALVFAGTTVGSVVLWDLREHSGSHPSLRVEEEEWALRYPTFSTDAVLSGTGHLSAVVSVEPVLVNMEPGLWSSLLAEQEESLGLSFQLGSLDENGLLNLWVVIELPKANDSGSQTDLGLRPGGKVKLLHSSSIQTNDRQHSAGVTPQPSLLMKFLPSDSNHYFIGTSMGVVRRGTTHGLRVVPKLYRPENGERPAEVTALDFCPSKEPFFLVGCSDGTVRLHSILHEEPVLEWSTGAGDVPVMSVKWSRTRLSVFCVLDGASVLHIWDLSESDLSPVMSESFQTDRVTAMAMFGEAVKQNRNCGMALAKQSGRLEVHFLKQSLTVPQPSDTEKLHLLARDNI